MFNPNNQFPELTQLNSQPKHFEGGDNVKWQGVAGKVVKVDKKRSQIQVKFINHIICSFTLDGRYLDWHNDPALSYCSQEELERQANEWYKENRT